MSSKKESISILSKTNGISEVIKRNGQVVPVEFDKITVRLRNLINDPNTGPVLKVLPTKVVQKVAGELVNRVTTSQIDEVTATTSTYMFHDHPDYLTLAGRIVVSNLHKKTQSQFSVAMEMVHQQTLEPVSPDLFDDDQGYYTPAVMRFVRQHAAELDAAIQHNRDYSFDFFGMSTLTNNYLGRIMKPVRKSDGKSGWHGVLVERPQYLLMREAICVSGVYNKPTYEQFITSSAIRVPVDGPDTLVLKSNLARVLETYEALSTKLYTHATPTMTNSCCRRQANLSSCFLLTVEDSIDDIYEVLKKCAKISQASGGIGINISNVRADGSLISSTCGISRGILPMLKVYEKTAQYVDQGGGKRKGSFAVYMEPWHADILTFVGMRRGDGAPEVRAPDLNYALWIPDLFMKRVEKGSDWTLFSPDQAPGLSDVYGEEFEALYTRYEAQGLGYTIPARVLWQELLTSQTLTGEPYMLYKDHVNHKSNQKNMGTIRGSNLCVTPDTKLLTRQGYQAIGTLENLEVEVWNGHEWSKTRVVKTQDDAEILQVTFNNGLSIKCTPYHKFYIQHNPEEVRQVSAEQLQVGDQLETFRLPELDSFYNQDDIAQFHHILDQALLKCRPGDSFFQGVNGPNVDLHFPMEQKLSSGGTLPFAYYLSVHHHHADDRIRCPVVTKIERNLPRSPTYCVNEPLRHKVVFNGVLTGNCAEVVEYTSKEHVAVCNLGSIVLPSYVTSDTELWAEVPTLTRRTKFDFEKLERITYMAVQNLDRVIDYNQYPCDEAIRSNVNLRPISLGVQGLYDVFALMRYPFDAPEARKLNADIFETMYYAAIRASIDLAKVHGPYPMFDGSPASQGLFQFDLWHQQSHESTPMETVAITSKRYDWEKLRREMMQYGLRNSLLLAVMPTASTSHIQGTQAEACEPMIRNFQTRKTLTGDFPVINRFLTEDLDRLGLYHPRMISLILALDGSIQGIPEIPAPLQKLYRTASELGSRVILEMAADRGKYICQTQSMNLFIDQPDLNKLSSIHFYGWKLGLKTGMYYLRSTSAAEAIKFTVDPDIEKQARKIKRVLEKNKEKDLNKGNVNTKKRPRSQRGTPAKTTSKTKTTPKTHKKTLKKPGPSRKKRATTASSATTTVPSNTTSSTPTFEDLPPPPQPIHEASKRKYECVGGDCCSG